MTRIKLLIVDDNFVARRGLRSYLESEPELVVSGEASTGAEAVKWMRESLADVVLMDIRMPDMNGIEATEEILKWRPSSKILMLTVTEDPVVLVRAIFCGAKGYLVYGHFSPEELVQSIKMVFAGGAVMNPSIPPSMMSAFGRTASDAAGDEDGDEWIRENLTSREEEVLRLIATGKGNREIGEALKIEEKTVKNHINNIYSKLHLDNRHAAILYSLKHINLTR